MLHDNPKSNPGKVAMKIPSRTSLTSRTTSSALPGESRSPSGPWPQWWTTLSSPSSSSFSTLTGLKDDSALMRFQWLNSCSSTFRQTCDRNCGGQVEKMVHIFIIKKSLGLRCVNQLYDSWVRLGIKVLI